jgi:hypothetical protein
MISRTLPYGQRNSRTSLGRIDIGPIIFLAGVVFFSIVIGGSAYFFRSKRTGQKDLMD